MLVKSDLMICVSSSRRVSGSLEGFDWDSAMISLAWFLACFKVGVAPCSGIRVSKDRDRISAIQCSRFYEAESNGFTLPKRID